MRFVVLGAGAIGGSVGARLLGQGHEVVFVARGEHLGVLRERGLRIEAPDGALVLPVDAVPDPRAIAWRNDDVVLLAVKTQDAADALRALALSALPTTPIVCLTNGLEAERIALRFFGDVHAVCVISPASFTAPGVIQQWSSPVRGALDVGRYPDGTTSLDEDLARAFRSAGFASEARGDVLRWKRGKLLLNLGNALEALSGPAGRESSLYHRAILEGRACFAAAGLDTMSEAEHAARRVVISIGDIAGSTRGGGSTWQSLARGLRDVESDYLNGEIVLLGRLHGVPTPVNQVLREQIAEAARRGSAPGVMPVADLLARLA